MRLLVAAEKLAVVKLSEQKGWKWQKSGVNVWKNYGELIPQRIGPFSDSRITISHVLTIFSSSSLPGGKFHSTKLLTHNLHPE